MKKLRNAIIYRRGEKPAKPAREDRSGAYNYAQARDLTVMYEYEPGDEPAVLSADAPLGIVLHHIRTSAAEIVIVEQLSDFSNDIAIKRSSSTRFAE